MVRLFIAVNLPEDLREKLASIQKEFPKVSLKFVEPENLHLTLKFLGETPTGKIENIKKAISIAVQHSYSFELEVAGLGAFPDLRRSRVIWAGVRKGNQDVINLQRSIDRTLAEHGFPLEKDFHPHVTLARVKSAVDARQIVEFIREVGSRVFGSFCVKEVDLMQSTLTPRGPIYTKIFSAQLLDRKE
ncbi:MAG: RNA 2',3'-cyclic phosphodiesterase [Candidatus Hadarchaeales archaeon]